MRKPLLDLSVSNPTYCLKDYPHDPIRSALGDVRDFHYQPDPFGRLDARACIADYYRERGISISPHHLILTASTSEAYAFLFKLLCDPGDEILVPVPSYPLFSYLADLECVRVVNYLLRYDGSWHVDLESIETQISSRTKAIVVVNPNNPTGTFLSADERTALLALAARYDLPVIADEVFMDYKLAQSEGGANVFAGNSGALLFSLNGLSKTAGMPQMKLAWIAVSGPDADANLALERMEIISDTYLSVATPVQKALASLMNIGGGVRDSLLRRIKANLVSLDNRVFDTAVQRLHLDGGWSAILQIPAMRWEDDWVTGLVQQHGVVTQPGYFFDMPREAYLVVSLITPQAVFEEGVEKLCSYVAEHS